MSKKNFAQKVVIEDYTPVSKNSISGEQRMNRMEVQEELNSQAIENLSFETFQKSESERMTLKEMKKNSPKVKKYRTFSFEEFKKIKFVNEK